MQYDLEKLPEFVEKRGELTLERNSNYAPGDVRANYFLTWQGLCIGGMETQSGRGLVADVLVQEYCPEGLDEDDESNYVDCRAVWEGPWETDEDFNAAKDALFQYALMCINSGEYDHLS